MTETKEQFGLIMEIVKRADEMGIMMLDRLSLSMDLKVANQEFNLRLQELLNADNFNFSHDVVGIQNNINRATKQMENFFVPRYATNDFDAK